LENKLKIAAIITLIFFLFTNTIFAQGSSVNGLNVGANIGGARLLTEIKNDFSGIINEFNNKFGIAGGIEFSKYISPRWEIGGEFGQSVINGYTNSPDFSVEGLHYIFDTDIVDPVEYKNKLLGLHLLVRYYFKDVNSDSKIIPFFRIGAGYLNHFSEIKYIDAPDDDLIFGKGGEGFTSLSTPVFVLGTGFKSPVSQNLYLMALINFNFVNYDLLDVVHNYNTNKKERLKITGLYTELKIGIFYNVNFSNGKKPGHNNLNSGRNSNKSHLPFAR
jgi:hypothetical protein